MHGQVIMKIPQSFLPENVDESIIEALTNLNSDRKYPPQILDKVQSAQKIQFDKKKLPLELNVGDEFLLLVNNFPRNVSKKLCPKYEGPYKVPGKISDLNYEINFKKTKPFSLKWLMFQN